VNVRPALVVLAVSLSTLPACAAGNPNGFPTSIGPESNLLCASEFGATRFTNLREAIHELRPRFLRGRGPDAYPPVAYVDGSRMTDLDFLHAMAPREIVQVLFESPVDATSHYGTGHAGGALLVSTVHGRTLGCGR
jgi:hypothetical protein